MSFSSRWSPFIKSGGDGGDVEKEIYAIAVFNDASCRPSS